MTRARNGVGTGFVSLLVVVAAVVGGVGLATATTEAADAGTQSEVTLTVNVVDRGDNPLDDAELTASWDGGEDTATTASNGKAFVDVPEGASVTIEVDHQFYIRNEPYVVENASEGEVEVEVARKGRATVVVRDEDGRVENAYVRMFQDGQPVVNGRTGSNGELETDSIERDDYTLITFKEGYARNQTTLTVDGTVEQDMTIEQATVLVTFRVTDDHFDPPQALVDANVTVPDIADVTTQGNGAVTVSVPVNDEYDVEVTKSDYRSVTETLEVRESRTSLNVTVRRTPAISATTDNQRVVIGETVRVTVTDEYGDPVSNASVSLDDDSVGETNGQGVLRVPVESAGNHTIAASSGNLETSVVVEGIEPAAEETATATATATATDATTTTGSGGAIGPGFGVGVGLLAILGLAALLGRRRR